MAKTKKKPSGGTGGTKATATTPYDSQVAAESTLRFGPEQSALAQAMSDALDARDSEIASAHSAAQGAIQTARQAAPQIKAVTTDALGSIDAAISGVAPMSGTSNDIARTRSRLAERLALAGADLTARQTRASEGEMYAVNEANARASKNRTTIGNRLIALGVEEGAFAQGRAGELAGADAAATADAQKAQDANTTQLLAAGVDPTTGQILAGGPKDPAANGDAAKQNAADRAKTLASPAQIESAASEITRALSKAQAAKKNGWDRHKAAAALIRDIQGTDASPVYTSSETRTGGTTQDRVLNPDGTQQSKPGAPGWKAVQPLWASIALDMAYDGHVSTANVKRLHNPANRYSVRELNAQGLNLVTSGQLTPEQKQRAKSNAQVVDTTSSLAQMLGALGGP